MNAIIFGCGGVGITAKENLENDGIDVAAFADNNEKKWGTFVEKCEVISPKEICQYDYDYVAIASYKGQTVIREQLLSMGIPREKIIVPIAPKNKIFKNPGNYTENELVTLSKDNYESESNKRFKRTRLAIEDKCFLDKIDKLKSVLLENHIPREKVCVVKGSVMIAYGLRASKRFEDIDIIMTKDLRKLYGTCNVFVSDDIEMVAVGYLNGRDDDEIINDVNKHFVFNGLKFMNLEDFYEYKKELLWIKPKKPGLKDDLSIVEDFIRKNADEFKLSENARPKIFVNPSKYTEKELVEISRDSCESEGTKRYERMNLVVEDEQFYVKLQKLKQILWKNNIPRNKVCVVRGAVMVAYGLRKLRDGEAIDIIMTKDLRELYGRGYIKVSDDAVMSAVYYMNGRDEDEIINDVDKHFVFNGLKFMNLRDVYEFKREVRLLKASKPEVLEDTAVLKRFFEKIEA